MVNMNDHAFRGGNAFYLTQNSFYLGFFCAIINCLGNVIGRVLNRNVTN